MRPFRLLVVAAFLAAGPAGVNLFVSSAQAQAVCRDKCVDAEQACLKRTSNKGQCGGKAQACLAKCKKR